MTTKMIRRTEATEHQIQCAIVEWARKTPINNTYGKIGDYLIAIPNGGKREKIKNNKGKYFSLQGKMLKNEGVKRGVPDLFLAWCVKKPDYDLEVENGNVHIVNKTFSCGLWIEVKKKGGKLSNFQEKFINLIKFVGHFDVIVVYTPEEGIQAIKDYLGMI